MDGWIGNVNGAIHRIVIFSNFLNMFSITGKIYINVHFLVEVLSHLLRVKYP